MNTLAQIIHGRKVILSDTVGFISDLPTSLIAAFRATLEEVLEAAADRTAIEQTFKDAKDDGAGAGNYPVQHYKGWTLGPDGATVLITNLPFPQQPGTQEAFTFLSPVEDGVLQGFLVAVDECGQESQSESFTALMVPDAGSDSDSGLRNLGCHAHGGAGLLLGLVMAIGVLGRRC